MRIIAKFTKGEQVKYISHLDVLRLFQRAIIRTDITPAYSQGFNPHILISFANALAVGVLSKAEYLECVLAQEVLPEDFVNRLNSVLPKGIRITAAKGVDNSFPALMAIAEKADYRIELLESDEALLSKLATVITQIQNSQEIIIKRKSNKGTKEINIRPRIYAIRLEGNAILCTLASSNTENLRPDVLWNEITQRLEAEPAVQIIKEELYFNFNGQQVPLL